MFIGRMRELFGGSSKGQRETVIQVDHAGRVGEYDRSKLDTVLNDFVGKWGEVAGMERLAINVKTHSASAKKHKFSVHAAVFTDSGTFRAESYGWDVIGVTSMTLDGLRQQMVKRKEKAADVKRAKRRLQK